MYGDNQTTIDHVDAQVLEDYEQVQLKNRRTRAAIRDTYGPKQPTKFRRQLPGKRKWKNKDKQYAILEGQMTVKEFNHKNKAMRVLNDIHKERAKARKRHALMD